jgi:CRP-like cAMP-binding protein
LDVICRSFSCSPEIGGVVLEKLAHRRFAVRAVILPQIDANETVFLVLAGRAHALFYSIDGNVLLLHLFNAGDIFGENAIFGGVGQGHEVVAIEDVEAGTIPGVIFVGLMERYSCIALSVSRLLTERLSLTTRRLLEMSTLSSAGRVHAELLRQARAAPEWMLRPAPILSEFALQVGCTRETVSRAINELERRGIIRRDPNGLKVVAPHRLEELIV